MIEVLGEMYYIDLDNVTETINISVDEISTGDTEQTINLVSFKIINDVRNHYDRERRSR